MKEKIKELFELALEVNMNTEMNASFSVGGGLYKTGSLIISKRNDDKYSPAVLVRCFGYEDNELNNSQLDEAISELKKHLVPTI